MRSSWQEMHTRTVPSSLPLETFAWATACVGSRAYRVRGSVGGGGQDAARLLPVSAASSTSSHTSARGIAAARGEARATHCRPTSFTQPIAHSR